MIALRREEEEETKRRAWRRASKQDPKMIVTLQELKLVRADIICKFEIKNLKKLREQMMHIYTEDCLLRITVEDEYIAYTPARVNGPKDRTIPPKSSENIVFGFSDVDLPEEEYKMDIELHVKFPQAGSAWTWWDVFTFSNLQNDL